ncbi:O-antigen ligase family protein [Streptomyces sp. BE308]|uniref:O-antigen ligase family protein n=1 Tax=Streptomyces sp. BE308 TaxID=3002529 RepID=UPI002E79EE69|nr:O-antigen ligase family protein [Streptomyces sp. BE308]MEE1794805.1 O-antigen ligase family protein [Streptomyces sp. BE308]
MTAPVGRDSTRERGGASDAAGAVILAVCAVWSLVSAAGRDTRPEGVLLALLAVAAGFTCGRICGTLLPVAATTVVSVAALVMGLGSRHGMPGATAASDIVPGHTGAATALMVLAAGAACCAAAAAGRASLRVTLRLLALGSACAALTLGSAVGFAAALGVLLCSLAAVRMRHRLTGLAGLALIAGLMAGASWAVAENALPEGLAVSLEGQLTRNRVLLWRDAVELARENPLLGVGPDRFGELSPTAQETPRSDGKPHSAPLQQAAEQGVVGVALLGAAFGWLLCVLWRSPRTTVVVLTAGAALTALAALAVVGNALSFTPVTAGAGLLAGLASARRPVGEPSDTATDTGAGEGGLRLTGPRGAGRGRAEEVRLRRPVPGPGGADGRG